MFFRSRRHRSPRDKPRAADHRDAGIPETTLRQTQQLQDWRRSAQRVTRAWNAWLAAESRDRAMRYRVFVAALADEERAAAEVERMVDLADAGVSLLRPIRGLADWGRGEGKGSEIPALGSRPGRAGPAITRAAPALVGALEQRA